MIKVMPKRSISRGWIVGGLVFVLALALFPSVSLGHAKLLRSQPAANATLKQAPKTVELWFSEELESSFSTIVVQDHNGRQVDKNNVSVAEGGKKLQIDLEDLGSGTYTVEWKALSTDQHTMKGKFGFTIALAEAAASISFATPSGAQATLKQRAEPETAAPAPSESESGTDWTMSFVRWLEYLAMMTLFGGFAFRLLVLGPSLRKAQGLDAEQTATALARSRRRFVELSWLSIGLLLLATLAALILQTAAVLDITIGQSLSPSRLYQVIRQTSYGWPWLLQLATLVMLAVVMLLISRHTGEEQRAEDNSDAVAGTALLWTGLGITALMFLSPSLTGHAAAAAKEWPLAVFSDWLHLVAAGFWVGGLFHLVLAMTRATSELDGRQRLSVVHSVIPMFTRLAIVSTLLIAITGVYNSWIHVDRFSALWNTPYGKTLSFKVLLFIPMIALGGLNTFVIHRRAKHFVENDDRTETSDHLKLDRAFRRSVRIEAALGVAVLLAAAVLVFLQPVREHPAMSEARTPNSMITSPNSR